MLKASGTTEDGQHVVFFGLSHENVKRLSEGLSIQFDGKDVALPGVQVVIFVGETEESMAQQLTDLIAPGAEEGTAQ